MLSVVDLTDDTTGVPTTVDLTEAATEADPEWKILAEKGQVLSELINSRAAWKHRPGLTERRASVTMVTEHSLTKNKRGKFDQYIT